MQSTNRINHNQPDYILTIVRKPTGWKPKNYFDVPPKGIIVSQFPVASYPEAHDDLVRCNRLSLYNSLDTWAVIQAPDAAL